MKETLMNMIRNSVISLSLVLLATPVISGQDLSRYRKFALGTSLAAISKQVGKDESLATLISQSPALIQQMTYWQADTSDNSGGLGLAPAIHFPNHDVYSSTEKVIAQWDDAENSVTFFHSSGLGAFGLAVF